MPSVRGVHRGVKRERIAAWNTAYGPVPTRLLLARVAPAPVSYIQHRCGRRDLTRGVHYASPSCAPTSTPASASSTVSTALLSSSPLPMATIASYIWCATALSGSGT